MLSRLDITAVSIFTKVSDVKISTLILRQRLCMFSSCLIFEECYIFEIESGVKSLLFVCLGNDLRPYCSLPPHGGTDLGLTPELRVWVSQRQNSKTLLSDFLSNVDLNCKCMTKITKIWPRITKSTRSPTTDLTSLASITFTLSFCWRSSLCPIHSDLVS